MATEFKNPLRKIISLTVWTFIVLLLVYIPVKYVQIPEFKDAQADLSARIEFISSLLWNFLSPILQIALMLIIVDWVLQKFGIDFTSKERSYNWNIQTIIAVVVIGTFALAALTNLSKGLDYLKDLSLVVVGFYFGTQKRIVETKEKDKEIKITEEHANDKTTKL